MKTSPQEDSRKLSWLLRHGANESGLAMDEAGWAPIAEVRRVLRMDAERLAAAVANNTKARLEVRDDRIRACQGHSFAGTPVTREALEASWSVHEGDDIIWHGTNRAALTSIRVEGLVAGERTHVHLAEASDSKVGKRARVDVLIAVSPLALRERGLEVYRASNGVLLVRHVPPECFTAIKER